MFVVLNTVCVKSNESFEFWIDVLLEVDDVGTELKQEMNKKADQTDLDQIKVGMEKLNLGNTYFLKCNIK